MDHLARSRRLLLAALLASACGAGKLGPVGVSRGGASEREAVTEARGEREAGPPSAMLPGLPLDHRSIWNKLGSRITSEHGRFVADVYEEGHTRFVEDLFSGDAAAGLYLIERSDAGVRFAVADPYGHAVADMDAGVTNVGVEACVRCHANARDSVFPVTP